MALKIVVNMVGIFNVEWAGPVIAVVVIDMVGTVLVLCG